MGQLTWWDRIKLRLADRLGTRYPIIVDTIDRAVAVFLVTFASATILGDGFDVRQLANLTWWHTAALAASAAALSVIKSTVLSMVTGNPALLSLTSKTLRARRDLDYRPPHPVPLRPRPKPHPRPAP